MRKAIDDFLFYAPIDFKLGEEFDIPEFEIRHMKVLRFQPNELLSLTNGKGDKVIAILTNNTKSWRAKVQTTDYSNRTTPNLSLVVAPTKNLQRMEWMVEKCVEIGVHSITPIICDRSERRKLKIDRLDMIAIAAMKQSKQLWKVKIEEAIPFGKYISTEMEGEKLIADQHAENTIEHCIEKGSGATILIGPEGGFSENEKLEAISAGFNPIKLSRNRLRTETAALIACQEFNSLNL